MRPHAPCQKWLVFIGCSLETKLLRALKSSETWHTKNKLLFETKLTIPRFCFSLTRFGWWIYLVQKRFWKMHNCITSSIFFIASKVTFCSLSYHFLKKVTISWKISLVEAMTKRKKMMRNKCSEKTLQVKIQCYVQLRSSLTAIMWNDPHIVSFFL